MNVERTRETTVSRGFRVPESVLLMLSAVQKRDGDPSLNDTAEKAFKEYCERKLAA